MDIVIKTNYGKLRGIVQETKSGFQYQSFQGIPYAKPPVGNLRFKDPQQADKWEGIKDAIIEGDVCPQIDRKDGKIIGDENCLFLNVYTPHSDKAKHSDNALPVMVWFHGGGFYKGSGNQDSYGPDYLLEKNIVYVTINYRFGVFGFLCLHSEDVPGNAGLKDQILALRWIKNNISSFGGDPKNITVFGESAGAASISYLTISPIVQGLFQKVIIQSGTSLSTWATQHNPTAYAEKLAERLNYNKNDNEDVLNYLQKISFSDVLQESLQVLSNEDTQRYLPIAFLPVVEKLCPGVESVVTELPEKIFESGKFLSLPTMAGYSSKEGVFMLEKIGCDLNQIEKLIGNLKYFLPSHITKDKVDECVEKIKHFYFDNKSIDASQANNVIDLLSDFLFRHPIDRNVYFLRKYSSAPLYYFQFSYQGNLSRDKKTFEKLKIDGASHSEECGYIFRKQYLEGETLNSKDVMTRQRLVEMWTNFAKTGNPTPEINKIIPVLWKPVTRSALNCLEIGKDLDMTTEPNSSSMRLWMDFQNMND